MSTTVKKVFNVVSSGRDEYPGDGLRLKVSTSPEMNWEHRTTLLTEMGLQVREGDEVEITARVISRIVTKRENVT